MKIKGTYNYNQACDLLEKALSKLNNSKSIEYSLSIELLELDGEYKEFDYDAELTLTEASKELKLSDGAVLRAAIKKGTIRSDEVRLVGKTYLIKQSAIERYRNEFKRNMGE